MKRALYHQLTDWKNNTNKKPLILKGARQVGKTTILRSFGDKSFPRAHYVNFEEQEDLSVIFEKDLNPKRILQELSFVVEAPIDPEQDFLILDEIQACPKALTSLNHFQEELPGFAICAAGSLLGLQLEKRPFPAGKAEYLEMHPMCFAEFLDGTGETRYAELLRGLAANDTIPEMAHSHLWNFLKHYFITGGLPEVVLTYADHKEDLFTAFTETRRKQKDLINGYMADIAKYSGKQNAMQMERLWKQISAQLTRDQEAAAPKFQFKGVVPGINSYARLAGAIDWLEAAGLLLKIHIANSARLPFSAYIQENRFKLLYFDIGILGAVRQLAPKTILDYDYGTYKGYFAENFIAQEFRYAGVESLYSWKEKKAEIEFLRETDGNILPVEVKSGWITQAKSLKVFAEKYKPPYRTVMSARNLKLDADAGVHHYPLYLAGRFPLPSAAG